MNKFQKMLVICFIISIWLFCFWGNTQEAKKIEFNTYLMQSTFRLEGEGSIGTAFFLGRPPKKKGGGAYFVLITAAHVLENMKGDQAELILRKVNKDWSYEKVPFKIQIRKDGKPLWTRNDDKDVDVAVMYIDNIPSEEVEISLLPIDFLADDKDLITIGIHPGDDILCLGYPFGKGWGDGVFPILRSGKISSHPLLPTRKTKVFLYDFEIFKGNSGGPVYISDSLRPIFPKDKDTELITIKPVNIIIGIVSEEFITNISSESHYEKKLEKVPLKLSKVIHASLIKETIEKLPERP